MKKEFCNTTHAHEDDTKVTKSYTKKRDCRKVQKSPEKYSKKAKCGIVGKSGMKKDNSGNAKKCELKKGYDTRVCAGEIRRLRESAH